MLKNLAAAYLFGLSATVDNFAIASGLMIIFVAWVSVFELFCTQELKKKDSQNDLAWITYASNIFYLSILLSIILGSILLAAKGLLLKVFAPGIPSQSLYNLALQLYWLIPGGLAFLPTAALGTILRVKGYYSRSFIPDTFTSLTTLVALVLLRHSPLALAISYSIGQVLGLILMAANVLRIPDFQFVLPSRFGREFKTMASSISIFFPIVIANQIFIGVDKTLGSRLPIGSLSAMNYSLLVIGLIYSLPPFATLLSTRLGETGSTIMFQKFLKASALYSFLIAGLLLSAGRDLMVFALARGKMTAADVDQISRFLLFQVCFIWFIFVEQMYQRIAYQYEQRKPYAFSIIGGYLFASIVFATLIYFDQGVAGYAIFQILPTLMVTAVCCFFYRKSNFGIYKSTASFCLALALIAGASVTLAKALDYFSLTHWTAGFLKSAIFLVCFIALIKLVLKDELIKDIYSAILKRFKLAGSRLDI